MFTTDSTESTLLANGGPSCQQRGQITFRERSILSSPGSHRVYVPGQIQPGKAVKFRSGPIYVVGAAGNLIRQRS